MKTVLQNLTSDVLKLDLSIDDTAKVVNLIRLRFDEEKQQIIDFASKCQLIRNVDCDGNVTLCFDPKEHFDKTFS